MSDDKVYYPETIDDNPLPGEVASQTFNSTSGSGNELKTTKISDQSLPKKRTAVELLSTALNTQNKRILQQFEFTESGAIQIGKYIPGISGDLRISPNGITARDLAGLTTFSIDGTTGNAIFTGEVRSGSLITGEVVVGDGNVIIDGTDKGKITIKDDTDTTIIDAQGLVSTNSFIISEDYGDSGTTTLTGNSATVPGLSVSVSPTRTTNYLVLYTTYGRCTLANTSINGFLKLNGNSTGHNVNIPYHGNPLYGFGYYIVSLTAGTHEFTITVQGDGEVYGASCRISLIKLGS